MNSWLLLGWLACQSLDTGTTAYALHRGYAEGNRLLPDNPRGVIYVKAGINVGAMIVYFRTGKPKSIPIVAMATGCTAGALNLRTIRKGN